MLSVLGGLPANQLASRDWHVFRHVADEVVSGRKIVRCEGAWASTCALWLAQRKFESRRYAPRWDLSVTVAALGWRAHLNTVLRSLVRVLDFDGDVHAAAKDSDLYWCILAHSVQFTSLVHTRKDYEARLEFVDSF